MEWITDWEYERIPVNNPPPPPLAATTKTTPSPHNNNEEEDDDDVSMQLDDDPEAPLPISHNDTKDDSHPEMAIFWTRASQEFSPAELQDMFGITTTTKHAEEDDDDEVVRPPPPPPHDDEDDYMMMMRPLHDDDKEGLLPPMKSPGGNAKYGLIKAATASTAKHNAALPSFLPLSTASMGTHTTVDLFADGDDSADLLDLDLEGSHHHYDADHTDDPMLWNPELIDRQHEVLQQVLEHGHQARSLQKHATTTSTTEDDEDDDAIFRRQQEIFQEMRHQDRHATTLPTSPSSGYTTAYPYPVHSHSHSSGPFQSPVSVVSGNGGTEAYQKQVEDWTQSNILERQRRMLRESMKRSLESRQALHIPPTSLLPQYKNHSKLSKVLQEIESSSHQIFRQTTSYHATPAAASNTTTTAAETTTSSS